MTLRSAGDHVTVVDEGEGSGFVAGSSGWVVCVYPARGVEPVEVSGYSEREADELAGAIRGAIRTAQSEAIEAAVKAFRKGCRFDYSNNISTCVNSVPVTNGLNAIRALLPAKDGG